jgi:hypothetical protein
MTHDSFPIAATNPARLRRHPHAATRESVGRQSNARRRRLSQWPIAGRAKRGVGVTTEAEIFRLAKY